MADAPWYYAVGGRRYGPVTTAQLKQLAVAGQLSPSAFVWREGLKDWVTADTVKGLFPEPAAAAPPAVWPMHAPAYVAAPAAEPADVGEFHGYAGFWKRMAATSIDGIVITGAYFVVVLVASPLLAIGGGGSEEAIMAGVGFGCCLNSVLFVAEWLYYALMESSRHQGTLGKMALGIRVTDEYGQRISFGRASGRFFAKLISGLTLMIGYVMAGFTAKKQALHDLVAGCLVVNK